LRSNAVLSDIQILKTIYEYFILKGNKVSDFYIDDHYGLKYIFLEIVKLFLRLKYIFLDIFKRLEKLQSYLMVEGI
jgi:hypothetical protein